MTSLQRQYMLCPPLACITARTRLGIDSINRRIRSCGILPHSCSRACGSSCRVCGASWRLRTRRSKSSHKWSIGFKSGDLDGQGALLHSGWLESQQWHELYAAECGRAEELSNGGSLRAACVVSKPHHCIERR